VTFGFVLYVDRRNEGDKLWYAGILIVCYKRTLHISTKKWADGTNALSGSIFLSFLNLSFFPRSCSASSMIVDVLACCAGSIRSPRQCNLKY
jgi:hypothetical protein